MTLKNLSQFLDLNLLGKIFPIYDNYQGGAGIRVYFYENFN